MSAETEKRTRGAAGRPKMRVRCHRFGSPSTRRLQRVSAPLALKNGVFSGRFLKTIIKQLLKKRPRAFRALRRRCVRVVIYKRNHLKPYACGYQRKCACKLSIIFYGV